MEITNLFQPKNHVVRGRRKRTRRRRRRRGRGGRKKGEAVCHEEVRTAPAPKLRRDFELSTGSTRSSTIRANHPARQPDSQTVCQPDGLSMQETLCPAMRLVFLSQAYSVEILSQPACKEMLLCSALCIPLTETTGLREA